MTKKRNLRNNHVSEHQLHEIQRQLEAQETGNYGVVYPGGGHDIGEIRDAQRLASAQFQDPRVMLPNPTARAPFDRTRPLDRRLKNEALGFTASPEKMIDLPVGDAGAGKSIYRRGHFFSRLDNPVTGIVAGNPMDKAIGMATYRSSDCRPRFWHVSFFGIGVQRSANAIPVGPLSDSELLSRQLLPVTTGPSSTSPFIPAITQLQGRIMVFDESGQRFVDVDIVGNRSLNVYAWGVTAFILGPENFGTDQSMYQVNPGSGGGLPQQELGGLVEDSMIGIRIVPVSINVTENPSNRTITVVTGDAFDTFVPIPPGASRVQVICHENAAAAASYRITFDAGDDGTFIGRPELGVIDMNPGESKSNVVLIPNAAQIRFEPTPGRPDSGWSLIFTVESQ